MRESPWVAALNVRLAFSDSIGTGEIDMNTRLTPRMEAFCQHYHVGGCGKRAYVAAGYKAATDGAAEVGASKLMRQPKVKQRIASMQAHGVAASGVTVERLTRELYEERALAQRSGDRIRALELVGKLHGLFVDKAKVEHVETIGAMLDQIGRDMENEERIPLAEGSTWTVAVPR